MLMDESAAARKDTVSEIGSLVLGRPYHAPTRDFSLADQCKVLLALRRFLRNDQAQFKSPQQLEAMLHMLERRIDILCVFPTGLGKSTMVALAVSMEPHWVTIMVVPLRALKNDFADRARQAGVRVLVWDSHTAPEVGIEFEGLVLVGAELFCGKPFQDFVELLVARRCLARLAVDEAHLFLFWSDFRPVMEKMRRLRPPSVPLYLMTATCPPNALRPLSEAFSASPLVIRASTVRSNHVIKVRPCC